MIKYGKYIDKPLFMQQLIKHISQIAHQFRPGFSSSTPTDAGQEFPQSPSWQKLRGGSLIVVGWLLSPLCWWNDLFFNLPVAYGFGWLCSQIADNWLLPGTVIGYWLSNVVGIVLIQFGAVDFFQGQPTDRNFKQDLLTGIVSSTVFTVAIVALIQLNILETPDLLAEVESFNIGTLLSNWMPGR